MKFPPMLVVAEDKLTVPCKISKSSKILTVSVANDHSPPSPLN